MLSRMQRVSRMLAVAITIGGLGVSRPTNAEASMTCPTSGFLGCTGHGFCNDTWAEAYCQGNGGPNCHQQGYECVNWPFNGCSYSEERPEYFCYSS
jgi:hypothetical protein